VPEADDAAVLVVEDLVRLGEVVVGEELPHRALGLLAARLIRLLAARLLRLLTRRFVLGHVRSLLRSGARVG
jgi:hypothetical protein